MSIEEDKIALVMTLRREGITDTRVLSALERVPRGAFVPDAFRDRAYENIALPIGQGQTISQPYVIAFMTAALEIGVRMKVLEVGTGSGYQAAVLARLCRRVYTVERHRTLLREAEARFRALDLHNVTTRYGDGHAGWPEQAPFDRIMLTAAPKKIPETLLAQLGENGVLIAPVGRHGDQEVVRVRRVDDEFVQERLLPVRFVPMVAGIARSE